MAFFSYKCETHGEFRLSLKKRTKLGICPQCQSDCKPVIKAGSVQVMERLDNGAMARSVERLSDIEQIMNDRADKHTEEFMKKSGLNDE